MTSSKDKIEAALRFLADQQAADGGFVGLASLKAHDFSETDLRPTVFYTALLVLCLRDVPGAESICRRSADYLLANKSEAWTWNYWQRDCPQFQSEPYPDDLDDTACALAALLQTVPSMIDGAAQAHLAQTLIRQETATSGPYATWLHDDPQWLDVDVAVNANIGFCLHQLGVELPGLNAYIEHAIKTTQLSSSYYVGIVPTIYFISRWYSGPLLPKLQASLRATVNSDEVQANPLLLAMAISSGYRLKLPRRLLRSMTASLRAQHQGDHWPAAALYFEPPTAGQQRYAGSAALTTAFALEALQVALQTLADEKAAAPARSAAPANDTLTMANLHLPATLRAPYEAMLEKIRLQDKDLQISGIADYMARACQRAAPAKLLANLNAASVQGWLAYSIFDDILDDQANPELLGVANAALRRTLQSFAAALPKHDNFQMLVHATLDTVDGANTWEVSHARAVRQNDTLYIKTLPDYGNLTQLWQRSAGHLLAMRGTFLALGYDLNSHSQQRLCRFFKHFIIARQLNDDAHDWEEDLASGHLSAVVCLLLADSPNQPFSLNLTDDLPRLQTKFWEETILEVSSLIDQHLKLAERALLSCSAIHYPDELMGWLADLGSAAERARQGRLEAKKFIETYAGTVI